jgi:COMPASS component SWD2
LQQAGCLAQLELPAEAIGTPLAAFDSTGLVFGVTASMADGQGHYIHLYDARNFSSGAFAEMKVDQNALNNVLTPAKAQTPWTNMTFNASGNQILISGAQGLTLTLDGFDGTVKRTFSEQSALCSCFTPDDKYVLTGNEDGSISCWNVDSGILVKRLEGHQDPVTCIAANPKYTMLASCSTNTALWLWK